MEGGAAALSPVAPITPCGRTERSLWEVGKLPPPRQSAAKTAPVQVLLLHLRPGWRVPEWQAWLSPETRSQGLDS